MATQLNKNRMRDTRILMGIALLAGLACHTHFAPGTGARLLLQTLGFALAAFCAIGRIYSSAFIGGVKNEKLVTDGPYAMCRNPLYFFSLCGALGVGLMTASLLCAAFLFGGFLIVYKGLIAREEAFLLEKFGAAYETYQRSVPRLWPDVRKFSHPDEMLFQPRFLTKAAADAVWWLAPLPLFLLAGHLQSIGLYSPPFHLF